METEFIEGDFSGDGVEVDLMGIRTVSKGSPEEMVNIGNESQEQKDQAARRILLYQLNLMEKKENSPN